MKRCDLLSRSAALGVAAGTGLPLGSMAAGGGAPIKRGVLNIAIAVEPTLLTSAFKILA